MALNPKQRQFLKAEAHALNPVVLLGSDGLSENVIKEMWPFSLSSAKKTAASSCLANFSQAQCPPLGLILDTPTYDFLSPTCQAQALFSANTNTLRRLVHAWEAIDIFDGEIRKRIHEFHGEIREGIDDLPLATVVRKRSYVLYL